MGKNRVDRNTIIQIVVITVAVSLMLMVWPAGRWYHSEMSAYQENNAVETGSITMEDIVLQNFVPQKPHIADMKIMVRVEDVHSMDRVFVTLYDADLIRIYQEVIYFTEIEREGCIYITPDMDFTVGEDYYYGINAHFDSVGRIYALYDSVEALGQPENAFMSYSDDVYSGMAVETIYHYTEQFSAELIGACYAGILVAAVLLYVIISLGTGIYARQLYEGRRRTQVRRVTAIALGVLAGVLFVLLFWNLCIRRYFGGGVLDILFYVVACISLAALAGYAIWRFWRYQEYHLPVKKAVVPSKGKITNLRLWRNYLQTLCFVFLFYAGIMYVNADIQWKQDLNTAWVIFFFGMALLFSYKLREVLHPANLIWLIVLIPGGMVYCHLQGTLEHADEIARVTVAGWAVWGIVLIRTLRHIRHLRADRLQLGVFGIWLVMSAAMLIARHGKYWPVVMAVLFTIFYLQDFSNLERKRLVHHFANAILCNFALILVLCLLYRPYEYYQFNRYPMWFHTVASTGMYLALVEAVALTRLFVRMRVTKSLWKHCFWEWLLNAVVLTYISFTVARTAMMSVIGILLILAIGAFLVYRPTPKQYLQVLGTLAALLFLGIPVCFTATRCIPAVVNQPVFVSETLEDFDEAVKKGEEPDSKRYMNVKALLRLWGTRLGAPEFVLDALAYQESGQTERYGTPAAFFIGDYLVSTQEDVGFSSEAETEATQENRGDEITNGRLSIFKDYLAHLTWAGHEEMERISADGMKYAHAHNSFIQNAYDFGILAGILFLLLNLSAISYAVWAIWSGRFRNEMMFLMLLVSASFLITSISEYSSNVAMPLCFAYLFLLVAMRQEKNVLK